MKTLFFIFLLIVWISTAAQPIPVADIKLADGSVILNAPSGRDWSGGNSTQIAQL